jgi:transposase
MAYSQDLRDRVLAAYDRGMQTKQIAEAFGVSRAWARRVKQRRRETGETTARPMGGPRVIKIDLVRLAELVTERPDATARELRDRLSVQCSESAVGMALQRLGLSFKKKRSMPRNRTARMSLKSGRSGSGTKRILTRRG